MLSAILYIGLQDNLTKILSFGLLLLGWISSGGYFNKLGLSFRFFTNTKKIH